MTSGLLPLAARRVERCGGILKPTPRDSHVVVYDDVPSSVGTQWSVCKIMEVGGKKAPAPG